MARDRFISLYKHLVDVQKGAGKVELKSDDLSKALADLTAFSLNYLEELTKTDLESKVPNKEYFMFENIETERNSRPVNKGLFISEFDTKNCEKIFRLDFEGLDENELNRSLYTLAISYCAACDTLKKDDKKTPGTFFENFIGHLVARALDVNPAKHVTIPTLDEEIQLPTDFVFDLGEGNNRLHLPVKTSTRERVIQVWAHQRVLDGMHGVARFKGVLAALAETNKQKDKSVVEVCLPQQWITYQMYIAQMYRVYYLDIPEKYMALKNRYPFIQVKPFSAIFSEIEKIKRNSND